MPYIKQEDRQKFIEERISNAHELEEIDQIKQIADKIENCGELNYVFTVLAINYIKKHGKRYQKINDVKGALQGALSEFDRRLCGDYEDIKKEENGDVYSIIDLEETY